MICKKCGTENERNDKFCQNCGEQLEMVKDQKDNFLKKMSKKHMGILGAAILAVALLIVMLTGKPTINLNDYVKFELNGYDGFGQANVWVDWEEVKAKYGEKVKYTKDAEEEYGQWMNLFDPVYALSDYITVEIDKNNYLSNGDQIAYQFVVDEKFQEVIACKIKCTDDTYQVTDLSPIETFDAFEDLVVTFSGTAPKGEVEAVYSGTELSQYDFSYDITSGLSNGDVVTVSIDESKMSRYAQTLGKIPSTFEKKYTVEGLNTYLSTCENMKNEGLDAMKKQAEDVYRSYVANVWVDEASLDSIEYMGNYLLMNKNSVWKDQNRLYLVYKVQSTIDYKNGDKNFKNTEDIYWYIQFSDVAVEPDGDIVVDVMQYQTPNDEVYVQSNIDSATWYYIGYESIDALYEKVVTSNLANYNYEDNVTIEE